MGSCTYDTYNWADDNTYDMVTVDRRTFTMRLATIDTSRLKNARVRELVELFQREAVDVLDQHFSGRAERTEHQVNAEILPARAQMELCQAAKGLIHPDHLEARAREILTRGPGEAPAIESRRRPLYTRD